MPWPYPQNINLTQRNLPLSRALFLLVFTVSGWPRRVWVEFKSIITPKHFKGEFCTFCNPCSPAGNSHLVVFTIGCYLFIFYQTDCNFWATAMFRSTSRRPVFPFAVGHVIYLSHSETPFLSRFHAIRYSSKTRKGNPVNRLKRSEQSPCVDLLIHPLQV